MKKFVVLHLLVALLAVPALAQQGSFFRNSYISLGASGNYYLGGIGGGADVTYGKWLLTSTGIRAQYSFALAANYAGELWPYHLTHFDIFFDPITALRGRNLSETWRLFVDIGFGFASCRKDNDFYFTSGIGVDKRIGKDWRLYAELSANLLPSDFMEQESATLMARLSLGATYDIAYNPTRSRSRYETRDLVHDWFFQVAMGVCSFNYKGIGSLADRAELFTPIFDFGIGKNYTSLWAARLSLSGLYAKSSDEVFTYYSVRGDLMLYLLNCLMSNREQPLFDIVPYISGSILSRLDETEHFMITAGFGTNFAFHIDDRNTLFLDARYVLTPPRFAHIVIPQTTFSVGIATVTLGYSYHFSRRSI